MVALPIYEYRCTDCAHNFEVSQRMSDDALTDCEVCQGELTKVLFAPAIHFKGSGFHNTDYGTRRRGGEGEGEGSTNGDGRKETGDAAGTAEAKANGSGDGAAAAKKEPATSGNGSSKKTVGLDKV